MSASTTEHQLARQDCWKYVKNDYAKSDGSLEGFLYSHIYLGKFNQSKNVFPLGGPIQTWILLDSIPQMPKEKRKNVRRISAEYSDAWDLYEATFEVLLFSSHLVELFENLEDITFTVKINRSSTILIGHQEQLVDAAIQHHKLMGYKTPKCLSVLLHIKNPGRWHVELYRSLGLMNMEDTGLVQKALDRIHEASEEN